MSTPTGNPGEKLSWPSYGVAPRLGGLCEMSSKWPRKTTEKSDPQEGQREMAAKRAAQIRNETVKNKKLDR